jgi:histidyl-tRNA synthetase
MKFKAVRGMKDLFGEEIERFRQVEKTARFWLTRAGYGEIATPILEHTEVFTRSIGEHTDIVEKEMYSFTDLGGDRLTLRPEATAGVLRACIEHHLESEDALVKLFTVGPMFRHERPQKGRFRQFYQVNAEAIGSAHPWVDAESVSLAWNILKDLGLNRRVLFLNSLGCTECRPAFRENLVAFLKDGDQGFCPDCQRRAKTNPLRLFDCKSASCQELLAGAPQLEDFLCEACRGHFSEVKRALDQSGIPYEVAPRLVRGLDYYLRTTFEIQVATLGAQNAVAGGGRYDGLVQALGGAEVPGMGFALGVDRILLALSESPTESSGEIKVFLAALGDGPRAKAFLLLSALRESGVIAEMGFEPRSLKSQMRRANRWGAKKVVILGEEEVAKGEVLVKDMETGMQESIPLEQVKEKLISD